LLGVNQATIASALEGVCEELSLRRQQVERLAILRVDHHLTDEGGRLALPACQCGMVERDAVALR
jgi:hypothetical protein